MSVPHVLIVDDDHALLQALPEALKLRLEEVQIDTCDNAATALDRIAKIDYDAIVSDIKMPGMDGFQVARQVREKHPDTDVILITAFGNINFQRYLKSTKFVKSKPQVLEFWRY